MIFKSHELYTSLKLKLKLKQSTIIELGFYISVRFTHELWTCVIMRESGCDIFHSSPVYI